MSDIISTIGDGIDKVVYDVTTAAETALPVLTDLSLQLAFEMALHSALAVLLS